MSNLVKVDLIERLVRLDEDADLMFDDDRTFNMIIVGGSALIFLEVVARATRDIDAIEASPEIRELLARYDINMDVAAYMNNFPFNYEDRIVPIDINTRRVKYYTASLEDIVIAKLCSGRPTDRQDIISEKVLRTIDWNLLDRLANEEDEIKQNCLNSFRYNEFKDDYDEYVRRYRPCANSPSVDF